MELVATLESLNKIRGLDFHECGKEQHTIL